MAAVAVGVVLLVAGAAKLRQPAWPATATAFGAPPWLAPVLPWVELVLGALLAAGVALPWTALAATALLAGFTVAVGARLARGDPVPCGCFGEPSPRPVGPATLVRNLVLVVVAAVAVATAGAPPDTPSVLLGAAAGLAFVVLARSARGAPG